MSTQKTRPIDAFQRIMNSFKHFENKLDMLQEDVNYNGKTLSDLRTMVTNLSGGTVVSADGKSSDYRRYANKTTGIQFEDKIYLDTPNIKRTNSVPPKLNVKSFQSQKTKITPQTSPFQVRGNKLELGPKTNGPKHAQRHKKADAQRKTNTISPNQKMTEKKRVRPTKKVLP